MGLNHVEDSISSVNKETVTQETFGHLAPKKNTTYKGEILIAVSEYNSGNPVIISMKWDKLEDSPWIFEAVEDFIWEIHEQLNEGKIYKIKTTFRNYKIWGKPKECILN